MTFLWAGYLLTWIALVVYVWRLESRIGDADRHLEVVRDPDAGATAPR